MTSKKDNDINMENLWFYFDSIERDCMDLGMLDRKASQLQLLKGKLLRLPQAEFDATIKTIEKLVEDKNPAVNRLDVETAKKKASMALYERTAAAGEKNKNVDSISRVAS